MSLGISGETCQRNVCTQEAEYCAVLTSNTGEVCAHVYLCEADAQEMFAIKVDYGERLARRVEKVKREQENPKVDTR